MNSDRLRWTDSRLDDRFETVTGELRALRDVPTKLGEMKGDVKRVQSDTNALHSSLRELTEDFAAYVEKQQKAHEADRKEREQLHEAQRLERKSDRRWIVGAVFTAAGLIIAAVGLLAGGI